MDNTSVLHYIQPIPGITRKVGKDSSSSDTVPIQEDIDQSTDNMIQFFRSGDISEKDIIIRTYRISCGGMDFLNFFRRFLGITDKSMDQKDPDDKSMDQKDPDDKSMDQKDKSISVYILHLAVKYGIINGPITKYRDMIKEDALNLIKVKRLTPDIQYYSRSKRYKRISDISPELLSDYLISMMDYLIRSISIHDFLCFSIDNRKTKSICRLIRFTNGISRIVRDSNNIKYFIRLIKILLKKSHYYLITTIISGMDDVPKKYKDFIRELSNISMSNDYSSFMQKAYVRTYSTDYYKMVTVPFIGILLTEIRQSYEMYNLSEKLEDRLNILKKLYNSLEILNSRNNLVTIDLDIDRVVQDSIDQVNLYRKDMIEWNSSDVQIFIKNSLKNRKLGQSIIDHTLQKFRDIDGLELSDLSINTMKSMGISGSISRRIKDRIDDYDRMNIPKFDCVHDVCMVFRKYRIERYDSIMSHEITPNILKYLDDNDLKTLDLSRHHLNLLKRHRRLTNPRHSRIQSNVT